MTTPPTADRSVVVAVVIVVVGYALLAYAAIAPGLNLVGALLGLVLTLAVVAVQLGYVSRPGVRRTREATAVALLALACLVYVPVVALSVGWIAFAGFLAGSVLVLLPPRPGLAAAAVVVVSVGLIAWLLGSAPTLPVVTAMVGTVVTTAVIHGLTRLWWITAPGLPASVAAGSGPEAAPEVAPTVAEPADEAAAEEPADEAAAEVPTAAASGPDCAEPVADPPDPPDRPALAVALGTARSELDAAGVELSVLGEDVALPGEVGDHFAALLRVAVGHAARHPDASSCHVTVVARGSEARIVVTHDGATDDPDPDDFEALGERFDAADGSVLAERDEQQFTVDGRLPITT